MLAHLKELFRYRDLLFNLALRDIKVRYRQTLLGITWAVMQPLAFMVIFSVVFGKFGKLSSDGTPYPLFSYAALVPWTFFATGLGVAVNSVAANINLVKKIYFPKEVFPIGAMLGCFVDFLVAASLMGGLLLFYRWPVSLQLLWVPWLIGLEVAFLLTIALFASALNVFYRDIKYIVPLCIQLGMFVTPVIYSVSKVPERFRDLYMLNPMAVVVDGMRRVILHGQPPDLRALLIVSGLVALLGLAAYRFFKRAEVKFADLI